MKRIFLTDLQRTFIQDRLQNGLTLAREILDKHFHEFTNAFIADGYPVTEVDNFSYGKGISIGEAYSKVESVLLDFINQNLGNKLILEDQLFHPSSESDKEAILEFGSEMYYCMNSNRLNGSPDQMSYFLGDAGYISSLLGFLTVGIEGDMPRVLKQTEIDWLATHTHAIIVGVFDAEELLLLSKEQFKSQLLEN